MAPERPRPASDSSASFAGEIRSWEDLRVQVQAILDALAADAALTLAAAANPVLAIEDLGYIIAPSARQGIEDRFRFNLRDAARLRSLRAEINKVAGRSVDPGSPRDLALLLFDELGLQVVDGRRRARRTRKVVGTALADPSGLTEARPVQVGWAPSSPDPLEVLRGGHPVVEVLLEYRRLEASEPRFASPELYGELRDGRRTLPITLRPRLKRAGARRRAGADA